MSDNHHDEASVDPRILHAAMAGCEQSKLLINRRALLGISASLFTWAYMPRVAEAATGNEPRLLIVILRGGMDGLHVVPPVGDPDYASVREDMALTSADTLPLGKQSLFRINNRLKTFQDWYSRGQAAIVQSVAPPVRIRSHFECQYNLETGKGESQVRSGEVGWLNKLLSVMGPGRPVTNPALAVGAAPLILAGPEEVRAWSPGPGQRSLTFNERLIEIYEEQDPELARLLKSGIASNLIANPSDGSADPQPASPLLQAFAGAGNLLRDINGPRIAVLSIEGWDTHASQFATLDIRLQELDDSLRAFRSALGEPAWSRTAVTCVTEFGRTVRPNGTEGTDHGVGTVALLAGGNLAGGKIYGDWRGLKDNILVDGRDLPATTDLRQLFKGVVGDHLGVSTDNLNTIVFPGSEDKSAMQGLIKVPASA